MKKLFQTISGLFHGTAKVPAQADPYDFISQDLKARARKVDVWFNLNTENCYESHYGYAITLAPKEDGFVVRDMHEKSSEKLSREEALEKVTGIIERVEEEYRNRPSEEEYFHQLMEKMAIPPEFTVLPNEELENYICSVEASYDESSGGADVVYVKKADTANADMVIDAIIRYKEAIMSIYTDRKTSWLTAEGNTAIWEHISRYWLNVHCYLIQADQLPELSEDARELCRRNKITFGTMTGLGYHDLLTNSDCHLEYEETWGAVDDAATIISWRWTE